MLIHALDGRLVSFEIWYQATRSVAGAGAFAICGTVLPWFMTIAIYQTSSRLTVAFAKDNAMLGSKMLAAVNPVVDAPVNALLFSWFFVTLFGCLSLGSDIGMFGPS